MEPADRIHVYYCLCAEYILILDGKLSELSRRKLDGSFVLEKHLRQPAYNFNLINGKPHTIKLANDSYELRHTLLCPHCGLAIAYTIAEEHDAPTTEQIYIYPRSLTAQQGKIPSHWNEQQQQLEH